MKKFGLLLLGGVAVAILLSNLAPMIALGLSLLILYYSYKGFIKTESKFNKVVLAIVGVIALFASASNLPAILGFVAAYVIYVVYKNWNKSSKKTIKEDSDPFTNFEKEWNDLKGNY
ncbi:flagellar basal body rod protein [Metabacillus litoralis]|uniref:lmo0954 family membrane protein n=1 Tax=Metabacillus TaxID=2675233 RepID=UPI000EF5B3CE|nr:flagellar basal body rod protein [Metabacillus litoralis]MCM3162481.1 flagellar basal body rod protein [Metabacillus litoralis]MCM3411662.1 flagellar basal body rod protein [Metabacillus litoralis]UHA61211.1 flagellar basal body rod protein [Metabacillus litoralis]